MAQDIFNLKKQVAINAVSATNGATITSNVIDLSGYDNAIVDIAASSAAATNVPTTLTFLESDTTAATSFTAITQLTGGAATSTSVGFVIPAPQTATSTQVWASFNIDARKRKRYLEIQITPITTQTFTAIVNQGRPQSLPVTASQQGVAGIVVSGI